MRISHSPSHSGWLALLGLSVLLWPTLPARAERLPIKFYSTADGLAHNIVYKIVRDSRGFLWFCTFEGLSRFDGYSFTTYGVAEGLPTQVVKDLLETRDGQYWVATDAGLCRFNPNGVSRKSATAPASQSSARQPMFVTHVPGTDRLSKVVTAVLQDRAGRIWCGTLGGLYRLEQQDGQVGLRHIPSIDAVMSMIEDRRGTLWVGSVGVIHRLLTDGRVERYADRQGLRNNRVQSFLEDGEGHLWAGTSLAGLWRLVSDPAAGTSVVARAYTSKDGLPTDGINAVFQATDGRLWAGSNQGLISLIRTPDAAGLRFRDYAEPDGLSYPIVHALSEDRNGNLWLGTNGGAAKFARSGITAFTDADGFNGTSAIFKDRRGDLVVVGGRSSRNFISRYDGERFIPIQPDRPQRHRVERIWRDNQGILQDHAGEWWVASGYGVYRFPRVGSFEQVVRTPPKATYTTVNGLASSDVFRVFEDSRGDIWVATAGGLSRWDRASDTFHRYRDQDGWLWRYSPVSFAEDRAGAIWIGLSIGGGLVRYRDGRFTRFTAADGLPEGGILALFSDSSGRLWVPASPGGLSRIDHPEAERPVIVSYTTAEGLAGNDVEAVTEDSRGRIYLGSAFGIDRLDPVTGQIRHYTSNEGALRGGVGPALRDRYGTLWFRYETGLVRLVPETDSPSIPTPVLITGLRISGEAQPISALGETNLADTELPARSNQIQIDFVAPGLGPGDESRYEYKLEGGRGDWSALGEQRTVNFAHLAAGRYRFLVRAISADGVLSDRPASFAFTIMSPVWQRWWFVTAAAVACSLLGYIVHRHRVTRLLELERVRTHIAADLHDDIGSSLSQISILSEVLRTQLGAQGAAVSGNISLINRVSQEALDSMGDIVWAINPRRDHLSDLVRRMRRAASEMLPTSGIEFTFSAPAGHGLRLGPDTRRQVFLMFKETINNIVRHARCGRAEIELKLDGPWLALTIADNGNGFDPNQVNDGNGLASLQRRARALGGETVVSSRRGEGTTVRITIPYGRHWRLGSSDRQRPHDSTTTRDSASPSE
jgi:ligand-binding sensor domain-containing protein/signal transduction histidine kinase